MASKSFNSVDGFSVGDNPKVEIILANGDVTTVNLTANGQVNLGNISNVHITGGSNGYIVSTDGSGNLTFVDPAATQSAAPMPITIDTGNTLTIPANYQGLFGVPLVIDGTLVVDGVLYDVNSGSGNGGGGNGSPGGNTTELQYNNAGSFAGIPNVTYSAGNLFLGNISNLKITGGNVNQYLQTDGSGNLIWANASSVPGGNTTEIQYNNSGNFAGSNNFTFDSANNVVNVPTLYITGNIIPTANITYDLGSNSNRFNDLYLSGNTIELGNATISTTATGLVFTNPLGGTFTVNGTSNSNGASIVNGNTNIAIPIGNSNINIQVAGQANLLRFSSNGFFANTDIFNIKTRIQQIGGNPNTAPLTSSDGKDRGLVLNYFDAFAKQAFIGWDLSNAEFNFASESTTTDGVVTFVNPGNIRAGYIFGNVQGNISGNFTVSGSNTQLIFNDEGIANGAPGLNYNKITNAFSASNTITAYGNLTAANLNTGGILSVVGNATIGNIQSLGDVNAVGNINGDNYFGGGNIQIVGNASFGNITTGGNIDSTGNLSANNLSITSNLTVIGNSVFGSNAFLVTSNFANFTSTVATFGDAGSSVRLYPNGYATIRNLLVAAQSGSGGNTTLANLIVNGNANFVGNVIIPGLANVGNIGIGNANISGTANITGNVSTGNITAGNLVSANFFQGDGRYLSNISVSGGTSITNGNSNVFVAPNANVAFTVNGNSNIITVSETNTFFQTNIIANANVSVSNTLSVGNIANGLTKIQLVATELHFDVNDNTILEVYDGHVIINGYANTTGNLTVGNNLVVSSNINVSGNATISGGLSVTGNANVGNIGVTNIIGTTGNISGNLAVGNISGANLVSANYLSGDGYLISNLTIGAGTAITNGNSNVVVAPNANIGISSNGVSNVVLVTSNGAIISNANILNTLTFNNANLTGTFFGNGSLNINSSVTGTSVTTKFDPLSGTGGDLSVANNASVGANLEVNGRLSVNGTANFWGGFNVDGTINGNANLSVDDYLLANYFSINKTGNIPNLNVSNIANIATLSVTGNITSNNINAGNLLIANFLQGDGYLISNITVAGGTSLTNGTSNLIVDGSGNVRTSVAGVANVFVVRSTGANLLGTFSASGNANFGNVAAGAGLFTGNVTGANANFTGNLTAGGPANINGNIIANGGINANGSLTALSANLGNLVEANFFSGDGYLLTNLTVPTGTAIINGNSNVLVQYSGDILFTSNGTANVVRVTSDSLEVTGNLLANSFKNGNSNIIIVANSDINFSSAGNANVMKVTGPGVNVYGVLTTIGGMTVTGNANIANLGISGRIDVAGNVTGGNLVTGGRLSVGSNANVGNLGTTGVLLVSGNANVGNIGAVNAVLTGGITVGANIDVGTYYVANLADPVNAQDAATKIYVDTVAQGLDAKGSVTLATTTSLPSYTYNNGTGGVGSTLTANANGALTIDSTLVANNQRLLIKNEGVGNSSPYNGIYLVSDKGNATAPYILTRATDFDVWSEIPSSFVFVETGTINADTGWVCIADSSGFIGTTAIAWSQFSGAGTYSAGTGLTLTGTQFSVNNSQTQITAVGTLSSLSVSGNINAANVIGGNLVTANYFTGTLTTGSQPNITSTGTLTSLSISGNANIGNIGTAGLITATGNITGGNIITAGSISATGNITGGNIVTGGGSGGNITGANVITANLFVGNLSGTGNSNVGNIGGTGATFTTLGGTLTTASQPNITSIGTLTSLSISGNANIGNIGTSGLLTVTGNITGGNLVTAGSLSVTGNANIGNIGTEIITATGNITAGNISGGNLVLANYISGTLTTASQPNITSLGTLSSLVATGNVTAGNILGIFANGNSNISIPSSNGNVLISSAGNANIVTVTGTGVNVSGTLNTTGNVSFSGANVSLGNVSNLKITGGTANYVLKTDGLGNLSWVAQSGGGGGSANIAIYDEGVLLTNTVSSLDFVGSGVSATANGNAVTVNISGGGGGGTAAITLDTFTGNGVQTAFTLSVAPDNENYTFVNIDGVDQLKSGYSVSGSTLTFSSAPSNGSNIEVTIVSALNSAQPSYTTRTYTGDGSQTTFTVTNGVTSTGVLVTQNGILQTPTTDYTVSGSNLVFTSAPANAESIQIRELGTVVATISNIANGTSNVNIPSSNGNVNISSNGNANILVVTGTGANVTGTFDATGNVSSNGQPLATTGKAIAMAMVFGG